MYIQKIYRDLDCMDAFRKLKNEVEADGYRVISFVAIPQPTLFEGKDDAFVEVRVVKENKHEGH